MINFDAEFLALFWNLKFEQPVKDIINLLENYEALTGEDIKNLAAIKIQQNWRQFQRRKKLEKQNFLFSKAEYLRRDAPEIRRIRIASQSNPNENSKVQRRKSLEIQKPPNLFTVSTGTQTEIIRISVRES